MKTNPNFKFSENSAISPEQAQNAINTQLYSGAVGFGEIGEPCTPKFESWESTLNHCLSRIAVTGKHRYLFKLRGLWIHDELSKEEFDKQFGEYLHLWAPY